MNEKWESITEPLKVIEYRIIEGFPRTVEKEINRLLIEDWCLNGDMQKITLDGSDIVVQCMVLYQKMTYM